MGLTACRCHMRVPPWKKKVEEFLLFFFFFFFLGMESLIHLFMGCYCCSYNTSTSQKVTVTLFVKECILRIHPPPPHLKLLWSYKVSLPATLFHAEGVRVLYDTGSPSLLINGLAPLLSGKWIECHWSDSWTFDFLYQLGSTLLMLERLGQTWIPSTNESWRSKSRWRNRNALAIRKKKDQYFQTLFRCPKWKTAFDSIVDWLTWWLNCLCVLFCDYLLVHGLYIVISSIM